MPSSLLSYLLVATLGLASAAAFPAKDSDPFAISSALSGADAAVATSSSETAAFSPLDTAIPQPAATQVNAAPVAQKDIPQTRSGAIPTGAPASPIGFESNQGSTYIPLDSWVYPAMLRLYSLGYVDSIFVGVRPWTRASVAHMLELSADDIYNSEDDQAIDIYRAVRDYLRPGYSLTGVDSKLPDSLAQLSTTYTRLMGIGGTPLRDSDHVGQTIVNDYGRPYQGGFNAIAGFSTISQYGRFSLDFRGEYQKSPSAAGYTLAQTQTLLINDLVPFTPYNPTIPYGPIRDANTFYIQEANAAVLLAGHEISFGKSDDWWGPGIGGGMAYSNNAQDIYSFRVNRVEPLHIPIVSRILGPIRYDFMLGSLKGHTDPNDDYTHSEGISFQPYKDFELGFERTIVWGGKGHEPVTLHTFLKGFFDINDTTSALKNSRNDPGARFSAFYFSWRLPWLRKYLTLYSDSEDHDDVSPISAPRRSAVRPGIYLSHVPGAPRFDFRVEGVSTDPPTRRSIHGSFMYWEAIQKQAYTNQGFLFGDWIGREAKGGQAWLTYHLSGNEWIQVEYRNAKAAKDFIPGGTTQNLVKVDVLKRLTKDVELNAWVQYESYMAPAITTGKQSDTIGAAQITWYPKNEKRSF